MEPEMLAFDDFFDKMRKDELRKRKISVALYFFAVAVMTSIWLIIVCCYGYFVYIMTTINNPPLELIIFFVAFSVVVFSICAISFVCCCRAKYLKRTRS